MSDKHTPGPWHTSKPTRRYNGDNVIHVLDQRGAAIAAVFYANETRAEHESSIATADAIAAAPDLLAALSLAVEVLADLDSRLKTDGALYTAEDAYDSFYQSNVADALEAMRAALTKASGAESRALTEPL